jgi:hypothetical protein
LNNHFDTIYFYIITEKQEKYPDKKLKELLPETFDFKTRDHIIDKDKLLQHIYAITDTPKLELLAKLYEHEFSDVQIEVRKSEFEPGLLKSDPEELFPNLLELIVQDKFYIANLNIDEGAKTEQINGYFLKAGKRQVKKIRTEKLIDRALKDRQSYLRDWILQGKAIYTFRDLHNLKEPLRQLIDIGTITSQKSSDYYQNDEDCKKVFTHLLRNTLIEFCNSKGIQWFAEKKILRFANSRAMPNKKQIKWKGILLLNG